MREIKFRVWDEEIKTFFYFDLSQNPKYWVDKLKDNKRHQFAGFKYNNTDVYEGDIFELKWIDSYDNNNPEFIEYPVYGFKYLEVKFDLEACGFILDWEWLDDERPRMPLGYAFDYLDNEDYGLDELEIKLIGNIYENPELLKLKP